jgi:hypothetical protein
MQLEELKNLWQNFDNSIENKIEVNHQLLKEVSFKRIKRLLSGLKREQLFELIITLIFLPLLYQITFNSIQNTPLMICGTVLILMMLATIIYNIYVLFQVYSIHYEDAILESQQKLERLKVLEIKETNLLIVLIPLVYLCILIMANAFFNFKIAAPAVLFWGLQGVGTLVITLIIVYFLKRFPNQSLQKAIDFIGEMNDLK